MRIAAALAALALIAACGGKDDPKEAAPKAATAKERAEAGWIWTKADTQLRAKPSPSGATAATLAASSRVPYTKVMDAGGRATWYWLAPPGGKAGWAPATAVSTARLSPAPAVTPAPGVTAAKVAAGKNPVLDARALTSADGSTVPADGAATDLATLQTLVDTLYPGSTPEKVQAARAADAAAFRKGIP